MDEEIAVEGETAGGSEHSSDGEWEDNLVNGELNRPTDEWAWSIPKKSKSKKMKRVK